MMISDRRDFDQIPTLDLTLVDKNESKQAFLDQLNDAAVNVGFLYLKGTESRIPPDLIKKVKSYTEAIFRIPSQRKLAIIMEKSASFMGYNPEGFEVTKGKKDNREQFDFGIDKESVSYREGIDPPHYRGIGSAQWPEEGKDLPEFKAVMMEYIKKVTSLSHEFTEWVTESLGFKRGVLDRYFDARSKAGGRIKMIRYPPRSELAVEDGDQGVGPHKDPWLTFLLQVTPQVPGLEVQNHRGDWIPVPPIEGTFVVNFGFYLEKVTHGAVIATTHRVVSPPEQQERLSLPFFQELGMDAVVAPIPEEQLPPELLQTIQSRKVVTDAESDQYPSVVYGESWLLNRVKSHPDVGIRHYPETYAQVFASSPEGIHPAILMMEEDRKQQHQQDQQQGQVEGVNRNDGRFPHQKGYTQPY